MLNCLLARVLIQRFTEFVILFRTLHRTQAKRSSCRGEKMTCFFRTRFGVVRAEQRTGASAGRQGRRGRERGASWMTMTGGALTHSAICPMLRNGGFVALLHFTGCFVASSCRWAGKCTRHRVASNVVELTARVCRISGSSALLSMVIDAAAATPLSAADLAKYTMLFITRVSLRPRRRGT